MARKSAKSASPDDAPKAAPKKRAAASATKAKASAAAPKAKKSPAKASAPGGMVKGRSLVIVESPKKAKSINKFLGSGFVVKASMGHVRDLPKRKLGLDVLGGYTPSYEIMAAKKETIQELKREAAKAETVYLATDPDREGEAIAWHLQEALDLPDERVRRVMFYEITEKAVKEAFNHVGPIDMDKVNAQQARRFLDRFVGYELSPLLWKKVARHLSAGRVQSVAVRLIAEREKEIRAFVSEEYWRIAASLAPAGSTAEADRFEAELSQWKGAKFAAKAEDEARAIRDAIAASPFEVSEVEEVEKLDKPDAPFKTSTLQQQSVIRLRFSGKRTMKIAQELYEGIDVGGDGPSGLITYMRTDSLRVSAEALTPRSARRSRPNYGERYLPKPSRISYAAGKHGPGGPRGDPPHRPGARRPSRSAAGCRSTSYKLYSVDLPPVRRQPDDARGLRRDQRRHQAAADGTVQDPGEDPQKFDGYRRVLAARRQAGGRPPARRWSVGQAPGPPQARPHPAPHPATAPILRGGAHQGAGEGEHRPAQHLRADHPDDPGPANTSSRRSAGSTRPSWGWSSPTSWSSISPRSST